MPRLDEFLRLKAICEDALQYPANGTRSGLLRYTIQALQRRLTAQSDDLFEKTSDRHFDVFEAYDGDPFRSWRCKSLQGLEEHLWVNRKDPRCRHV